MSRVSLRESSFRYTVTEGLISSLAASDNFVVQKFLVFVYFGIAYKNSFIEDAEKFVLSCVFFRDKQNIISNIVEESKKSDFNEVAKKYYTDLIQDTTIDAHEKECAQYFAKLMNKHANFTLCI